MRLLMTLALFCMFSAQAFALSVDDVRFGVHPDKTRLVLDLSSISDFRVFVLSNPYRMVIDLPDFDWQASAIENPLNSKIKAIRHGNLQPGISRIVFDLNEPISIRSAFALPQQTGKSDRLVIDFGSVSEASFQQEKGKVHGTLTVAQEVQLQTTKPYRTASLGSVAPPIPERKAEKPLVIIDPGHGGIDPGAVGSRKILEKNVVLSLAKELKKQLEETGQYRVLLTRESDVFIKLSDRVKFARKHEADLFVSIHADSIEKSSVRGASFYTLSENASDAQTARLAARENRADLIAGIDLSTEDEEVANILVDLAMRDTTNQGKFFANKAVDAFKGEGIQVLPNPHRHAGFAVLKAPDIPSVLVEAGFMSNRREAEQLNTASYRKKIASSLRRGIDAYFEQVRKNQRI